MRERLGIGSYVKSVTDLPSFLKEPERNSSVSDDDLTTACLYSEISLKRPDYIPQFPIRVP